MLTVASLFSQILGKILRVFFLQTGHTTRFGALFERFSFLDPVCFDALLSSCKGRFFYARYATVYKVAKESSYIWE